MNSLDAVKYLRLQFSIADPDNEDTQYLKMTDEDIELILNTVMLRNFPQYATIELLPQDKLFPVILLAKKELFYTLAVKEAPLYDIGADSNNYLKRSQRFKHYMQLVAQADLEFQEYLENGGAGANTLTSYDVLLSGRYDRRSYEKGVAPALLLEVVEVTNTTASVRWECTMNKFGGYEVYIHTEPIADLFNIDEKINKDAKHLVSISDYHQKMCRIEKLVPDTEYFILVVAKEFVGNKSYKEVKIKTLP